MERNQNFIFTALSISTDSGFLYHGEVKTQVRLIRHKPLLAKAIETCTSLSQFTDILKEHPNDFQLPPVALIGPKEATDVQRTLARQFGSKMAHLGLTVICGGRTGAMEAVCQGVHDAGGRSIGLLPGDRWQEANPYVTIPVVTNMGPTRNSLIAKTAFVLVAIGGGYGTLTEMAYGLHYGKPVIGMLDAPCVQGALRCTDLDTVSKHILTTLMGEVNQSFNNTQ
ncbi:TIGR00725 family protein [Vibrio nigripulchritudo]|uniref:TIGR00725 family protein n=1 Tax=Vibrio nigripulchritudo TaxID=28173 RepID=UPI0003B233D8|nr:TIGR00725 family protein [Vibrio nigripulchritudo]CCN86017.1 hypothetical protein VIBNIBLFn1_p0171 [Vibrio nigripulchritudo BLFn1]CCN97815.1 hypothetical protein VIBNIENn2_p0170 [Vibrio nigripulchritudo ENn2]CCO56126.1 hypothetical protein VIBNIWn13_p0172 [Vibrio nigripulchritudo Wn13]